jgi:hypothetical protein
MINRILVFIVGLVVMTSVNLFASNDTSDEAKIKAVVKQAFLTEYSALTESVEYDGRIIPGKERKAAFDELAEYVSDKKGYLSRLKELAGLKEGNERRFFAKATKRRFKDFDFKAVAIDGDTAAVEVDIYSETTTHMGATSVTIFKVDDLGAETVETPEHDIVTPGGKKHMITLERIDNKWRIVMDEYDYLPGYQP